MKHTRQDLSLMRAVENGTLTLAEAARRAGTTRMGLAYRFWTIHVHRARKAKR